VATGTHAIYRKRPWLTEVILYCVHYFDAEVRNGGFHQYFMNSAGDAALITLEALMRLGEDGTTAPTCVPAAAR
jgi:hypothetical protein